MSIPNHIQKEIQDYDSLVEELHRISKNMTGFLRSRINGIIETEKFRFSIKQYVLDNGIPIASSDELYSLCSKNDVSEKGDVDEIRAAVVFIAIFLTCAFYKSVCIPLFYCLKARKPELIFINSETCMTQDDINSHILQQNNKYGSLRNTFEKLKQFKPIISLILQTIDFRQAQLSDQDFIQFNDILDSVLDDNYELFKKTANTIGMREFIGTSESIIKVCQLIQALDFEDEEKSDFNDVIMKYYSMSGISIDFSSPTPMFCRTMFNHILSAIITIDNLPPEAKKAIESFWEELDISWLKDPFKKWAQDEFQIIKKSVQKENKKSKTREKTKPDHLNVVGSTRMIRMLAEGLVQGHDAPYLPKLVSSSRVGKKDAINQLVYLFTGETDNEVKLPYNLVWNDDYCLNGLRLLIYLLHFSGEFKDNDPLNALDDNDETSKDGISEVIKFKNTGRRPIFPIVEKAFGTGDKSVQNAKKPKGGNRDFLEQIIHFWCYCKNSHKSPTE